MSFYVTVVDAKTDEEMSWLCGWHWYDFGKSLGGVFDEDDNTIHTLGEWQDLFNAIVLIKNSNMYKDIAAHYNADERSGDNYLWNLLGFYEYEIDFSKYDAMTNQEVAKEMYAAELEFVDKKKKEAEENRVNTLTIIKNACSCIENDYLRDMTYDMLTGDNFMSLISFVSELNEYDMNTEVRIILG